MQLLSKRIAFQAKAMLCTALIITQPLLIGCQSTPVTAPIENITAARYHVELTGTDDMSLALEGTTYQGASAIDVFPAQQRFELVFSDSDRKLSGTYAFVNGEFTILEFGYANKENTANFSFSEAKQITRITTNKGEWKRPPESFKAPNKDLTGVDAYKAANADIIELAQELDATGAKADGGGLIVLLAFALLWSAYLFAPVAFTLQVVFTVFIVSTLLQNVVGGRFDGTWNASNQLSTLELTISDGRITRMVDVSGQQQLTIVESDLEQVMGNNVNWKVRTSLLGNPAIIQFDFAVTELATGQLSGTLTTNNSFPATVPVLMDRVQ